MNRPPTTATNAARPRSDVSVVISRSSSFTASPADVRRPASHTATSRPNGTVHATSSSSSAYAHASTSRIPYADKGKWTTNEKQTFVDSDEEYIGLANRVKQNGVPSSKGKERQSYEHSHKPYDGHSGSSNRISHTTSRALALERNANITSGSDHSMELDTTDNVKGPRSARHFTPEPLPLQAILDRPPPTPPPLPTQSLQPWYCIYSPEVAWAKLEPKAEDELKTEIEYLSEGSQGRASASKMTVTSIGALSRTPSKNRMRMVPANIRARSRSRRGTHVGGHDSDSSASYGRRRASPIEAAETSTDDSAEDVSPVSSSESDSDREETDGTDTEVEELIEFKKETRAFSEITYGTLRASPASAAASSSSSPPGAIYVVPRRKRLPFLEETLPDTYGPPYPAQTARIMLDAAKPGLGPRAVARKSFARAIGARLLSKKRREAAK